MEKKKNNSTLNLPSNLLSPIKEFLEKQLVGLKKMKKTLKKEDPFFGGDRSNENSLEEDLDEQIGHFDTEVKMNFLTKRTIQLRKALTMVKLGKYGICEKCGKMIDTARLIANPEATTCVKCEKESEA